MQCGFMLNLVTTVFQENKKGIEKYGNDFLVLVVVKIKTTVRQTCGRLIAFSM